MEKNLELENNIYQYKGIIVPDKSGKYGFAIRLLPKHQYLANPYHLHKIYWF